MGLRLPEVEQELLAAAGSGLHLELDGGRFHEAFEEANLPKVIIQNLDCATSSS